MYTQYEPYRTAYKESQSLKGLAKMKYDKEHKESLEKYPELREKLQSLLEQGGKDRSEAVEGRNKILTGRV